MRIDALREFLEFARWMSVRRAAEELHMSQSTLSKHIAALEQELGLALLDRSDLNDITLTRIGQEFAKGASYAISSLDSTLARCNRMRGQKRVPLRIQELSQNDAMVRLYALASMYESENDFVDISYHMFGSAGVADAVGAPDSFDVLATMRFDSSGGWAMKARESGLVVVPLHTEPMVVWYKRGNPRMAGVGEDATFGQLVDVPIHTVSSKTKDYFGEAIALLFEEHGELPRFRASCAKMSFSSYFLADFEDGIFCATRSMGNDARIRSRTDLESLTLRDSDFRVTTYLTAREDNPAALAFLDFAQVKMAQGVLDVLG